MALVKRAVALLTAMTLMLELIHAAVYKVGDSAGWTTSGNVDYKQWSATKTFQVGDVISKLITLSSLINPYFPVDINCFLRNIGFHINFKIWLLVDTSSSKLSCLLPLPRIVSLLACSGFNVLVFDLDE
ncbi:hypothetical protein OIU76_011344 [Salix suchowensis]|nr:hypothetical protein OIU76_011344 [Salix suchowensis]